MRAIVLGFAVAAAMPAIPALAQFQQGQEPAGSYRQSCNQIEVYGSGANARLTATCRDIAGSFRTSTLIYLQCRGDIGNSNGMLACTGAPPATAGNQNPGRGQGGLPAGSYRQSCNTIEVYGNGANARLTAACRDTAGGLRTSTLAYLQCRGDIANSNGMLSCVGAPPAVPGRDEPGRGQGRGQGDEPAGSYRQSCNSIDVDGGGPQARLTATCRDYRGTLRTSTLLYRQCRGDISAPEGVLTCAGAPPAVVQGGPGPGRGQGDEPAGSYRQTCNQIDVDGSGVSARLTATCRDYNGRQRTSTLLYRQCRGDIGAANGILACPGAPPATVEGGGRGEPPADGLPAGNWRQSCTERRLDRVWVKAQCLNSAGRRVLAEANWEQCPSFSYSNINGRLVCDPNGPGRGRGGRPGGPGYDDSGLPGGDWRRTCQGIASSANGNVINARCLDDRNALRATSIDLRTCRYRVLANENGVLRCSQ